MGEDWCGANARCYRPPRVNQFADDDDDVDNCGARRCSRVLPRCLVTCSHVKQVLKADEPQPNTSYAKYKQQ